MVKKKAASAKSLARQLKKARQEINRIRANYRADNEGFRRAKVALERVLKESKKHEQDVKALQNENWHLDSALERAKEGQRVAVNEKRVLAAAIGSTNGQFLLGFKLGSLWLEVKHTRGLTLRLGDVFLGNNRGLMRFGTVPETSETPIHRIVSARVDFNGAKIPTDTLRKLILSVIRERVAVDMEEFHKLMTDLRDRGLLPGEQPDWERGEDAKLLVYINGLASGSSGKDTEEPNGKGEADPA